MVLLFCLRGKQNCFNVGFKTKLMFDLPTSVFLREGVWVESGQFLLFKDSSSVVTCGMSATCELKMNLLHMAFIVHVLPREAFST